MSLMTIFDDYFWPLRFWLLSFLPLHFWPLRFCAVHFWWYHFNKNIFFNLKILFLKIWKFFKKEFWRLHIRDYLFGDLGNCIFRNCFFRHCVIRDCILNKCSFRNCTLAVTIFGYTSVQDMTTGAPARMMSKWMRNELNCVYHIHNHLVQVFFKYF